MKKGYGVLELAGGAGRTRRQGQLGIAWGKGGFSAGTNVQLRPRLDGVLEQRCSIADSTTHRGAKSKPMSLRATTFKTRFFSLGTTTSR